MKEARRFVPMYKSEKKLKDMSAQLDDDRPAPTDESLAHLVFEISQAKPNPNPGRRRKPRR